MMFERFTDRARRVVVLAQEEARLLNHGYIGTEHILLGLIHEHEGVAAKALESMDVSLSAVRSQVEDIIGRGVSEPVGHIPFTPRAKKVLELSLREALGLNHNYIGTEHILLGLIREGEGVGAQVLQKMGADFHRVRQAVIVLLQGHVADQPSGAQSSLDPSALARGAAERARRAKELSQRLAEEAGDPSISAEDVLYGFLIGEERLLALEILARRIEEGFESIAEQEPPAAEERDPEHRGGQDAPGGEGA
jgi:ATP-dependent Clp protease ATP-binding subunit ClpC